MNQKSFYVEVLRPGIATVIKQEAIYAGFHCLRYNDDDGYLFFDTDNKQFESLKKIGVDDHDRLSIEQAISYFTSLKAPVFNLGVEIETMLTSLNKIRENMLTDQNS